MGCKLTDKAKNECNIKEQETCNGCPNVLKNGECIVTAYCNGKCSICSYYYNDFCKFAKECAITCTITTETELKSCEHYKLLEKLNNREADFKRMKDEMNQYIDSLKERLSISEKENTKLKETIKEFEDERSRYPSISNADF